MSCIIEPDTEPDEGRKYKEIKFLAGSGPSKRRWWPIPPQAVRLNPYHLCLWWVVVITQEMAANAALLALLQERCTDKDAIFKLRAVLSADRALWSWWADRLARFLEKNDEWHIKAKTAWWSPAVSGEMQEVQQALREAIPLFGAPRAVELLAAAQAAAERRGVTFTRKARTWVRPWLDELGVDVSDVESMS